MSKPTGDDIKHITIDAYEKHFKEYIKKRDQIDFERNAMNWPGVDFFLNQLQPGSTIFEIGSGSGLDASRMEERGFKVIRSDVAKSFINNLIKMGFDAKYYDVTNEPLPRKQPAIFANAVLLHFDLDLFRKAIENIKLSLSNGGYICLGMKLGDSEGWTSKGLGGKRYIKLWSKEDLSKELENSGFVVKNLTVTNDSSYILVTAQLS